MFEQSDADREIATQVYRDYERASSNRGNLDSHCREIAERVWPSHSKLFSSFDNSTTTKGEKRNQNVYDSTASKALTRFGAILDSLLTPRNQKWHRVIASNGDLQKDSAVKIYFEQVNNILFKERYAPNANFASQNQLVYQSLGAFGTGTLFIDGFTDIKGKTSGLRYRNITLAGIYFMENHQGIIDTAIRRYSLTARNAVDKFKERCPENISNALKTNPDQEFWFIHEVCPRTDMDWRRLDFKGMVFASYTIAEDGKVLVQEGGYNSWPFPTGRYTQVSGEVYGRSPAMEVLPAIKTINEQKKGFLRQTHRAGEPVFLAYDDGVMDGFNLTPGAVNFGGVNAQGQRMVQELPFGNIQFTDAAMDKERADINDAFLVSLFQILMETPTMTATEVLERTKEKGILLAPTVGRQNDEYLGPTIEREIDVLAMQGKLPPMPPVLKEARGEYSLIYDSPLSRAQRAEEATGIQRTIESTLSIVNVTQNPAPLDFFDFDKIVPALADIQGVPASWMRDMDAVTAIRQGRAQQAQQAQAQQAAPGQAALIKAGSQASKM